jgi:hypothetical protein
MLALQYEKKRDFNASTDAYLRCLQICTNLSAMNDSNSATSASNDLLKKSKSYLRELRGEIVLRMALLKKAEGLYDQVIPLCENILVSCSSNTLDLKLIVLT